MCISSSTFPDKLKITDIIPVYKKHDQNNKTNYWPISLLPIISKTFEKVLYSQLRTVANKIFPQKLCGFRKGQNSQNALLTHFRPMFPFYTPWKHHETFGFLVYRG